MTRMMDLSPIVQPGDMVYVVLLHPDGTPTGTGYQATVKANGAFNGAGKVRAGQARVEAINRRPAR